jgi:hypothetical protein
MALTPPAPSIASNPRGIAKSEQARRIESPSKRLRTSHATSLVQDMVEDNHLSKYVNHMSTLLRLHGWKHVVQSQRKRGDFGKL